MVGVQKANRHQNTSGKLLDLFPINLFSTFSLTVHFLDAAFSMQKVLFGATVIEGEAKGEDVKKILLGYMDFAAVEKSKVSAIVRDDGPNIKKAAKLVAMQS